MSLCALEVLQVLESVMKLGTARMFFNKPVDVVAFDIPVRCTESEIQNRSHVQGAHPVALRHCSQYVHFFRTTLV